MFLTFPAVVPIFLLLPKEETDIFLLEEPALYHASE